MIDRGTLDIAANRAARKYTTRELAQRAAWSVGAIVFRLTPRPLFGWRRLLLRAFGARIGRHVHVHPTARIFMPWNVSIGDWSAIGDDALIYSLGPVTIGARVTISHRAHLCAGTHDHRRSDLPLLKLPISVGDDAWICADAFIGPNVVVGIGSVVGAAAVVVRDVVPWQIVAGNPARKIGDRAIDVREGPPTAVPAPG